MSSSAADPACYEMKMNIGREETQCSLIMLSDEGFISSMSHSASSAII